MLAFAIYSSNCNKMQLFYRFSNEIIKLRNDRPIVKLNRPLKRWISMAQIHIQWLLIKADMITGSSCVHKEDKEHMLVTA